MKDDPAADPQQLAIAQELKKEAQAKAGLAAKNQDPITKTVQVVRTVEVKPKWQHIAGVAMAGAGVLASIVGGVEGARSRSLANQANAAYQKNGGAYFQQDIGNVNSSVSAQRTANVLFVAGAALLALGLTARFAF